MNSDSTFQSFFEHFGGFRHFDHSPKEDLNKHYKTLGIPPGASQADIRKAYHKLAKTTHPDRGGDKAKFQELQHAYQVLCKPQASAGLRRHKPKKTPTTFPLPVTLEDVYNGAIKKLKINKNVVCKICLGTGRRSGASSQTCTSCQGRRFELSIRQVAPGVYAPTRVLCSRCNGEGVTVPAVDRCQCCGGDKFVHETQRINVFIDKGMADGKKIVFSGEGDETLKYAPGDVVVVLEEQKHVAFRRDGSNLVMKQDISLLEALAGFHVQIRHLDGRVLSINNESGVISPGDVKIIEGEGLPELGDPFAKGDLVIEFRVQFPSSESVANPKKRKALKSVLGECFDARDLIASDDMEVVKLKDFDVEKERKNAEMRRARARARRRANREDDEFGEDGHEIPCRTQ